MTNVDSSIKHQQKSGSSLSANQGQHGHRQADLDLSRINALETGIIGQHSGSIALETSLEHKAASLALMDQARRNLDILSYDLDPKIYNNREVYTRFRKFATLNRHSQIRVLIHDAKPMVLHGHMLIELIQRLTSSIEVRRLSTLDRNMSQGFLIADKTAYVLRPEVTRFDGHVDFNNRYVARELGNAFENAWQRAENEPELRRLYL